MEIHNVMEDLVIRVVDSICREESAGAGFGYCTSDDCRVDVICYVLNRVSPRYVSSSRGLAHLDVDLAADQQLHIDLVALANEGFRRVSLVRRSYYDEAGQTRAQDADQPAYRFPAVRGRILNGMTFEPMTKGRVSLLLEGETVGMIDARWQNPFDLSISAPGTYFFHPAPEPAGTESMAADFKFEILAECEGYEPLHHYFSLEAKSRSGDPGDYRLSLDFGLPDLYILPS